MVKCKCGVKMLTDESYATQKYMTCPKCNDRVMLDLVRMGHKDSDCFTLVKGRFQNNPAGAMKGLQFA